MRRWLKRLLLAVLAAAVMLALAAWWLLRGSLPALEGEAALAGLSAAVAIERDALGVVTIDAANEADAMRALGYVHAQERYFEMDLMRRAAAGELAELFGPLALDVDRRHRLHRMRARVDASLEQVAGERLPLLQAYTDGANAGLAALRTRPWPYLLLRQPPAAWRPSDSALVGYAMYFDLQDAANTREWVSWKIKPHLPAPLHALLTHPGSRWDAPLAGDVFGDAILPGPDAVDLRTLPGDTTVPVRATTSGIAPARPGSWPDALAMLRPAGAAIASDQRPGSNNFAVSGAFTADGRAIVADDMHLGLRAPNVWFRARLRWPDARAPGGRVDVQGVTLPGLPAVVVGSNGHVAWGYTNSYGDYLDWALETPCAASGASASAGDATCSPVRTHAETINVAGADPVPFEVRETVWGPLVHALPDGRELSLRWTAHLPGAINLGLTEFAFVADIESALAVADRAATPTQNLVIGDAKGDIAWRLLGPLPQRAASCPASGLVANDNAASDDAPAGVPQDTAQCPPWAMDTGASPIIRSPLATHLWTANARVASGDDLSRIGDGGYALGARAGQIRDGLRAKQRFDEHDLLAIQLDDRALFLTRWRAQLRSLGDKAGSPALRELAAASDDWDGRASVDSVGYRVVHDWRRAVHERLLDGLVAPARAAMGEDFEMPWVSQFEGVAWPLVEQRPAHLLPRRFESWQALFEDAAREVRDELVAQGPLHERTWGEANTAGICHPLAAALPAIGRRLLCMPRDQLPGDADMPRVQGPAFGASQRMVVSPGHEADGVMHMPGGQSGHPLSPFWGAGHDDWVHGRPTPFLPGPSAYTLTLRP